MQLEIYVTSKGVRGRSFSARGGAAHTLPPERPAAGASCSKQLSAAPYVERALWPYLLGGRRRRNGYAFFQNGGRSHAPHELGCSRPPASHWRVHHGLGPC